MERLGELLLCPTMAHGKSAGTAVCSLVVASNDKPIITCQSTPGPFALGVGGLIRLDLYGGEDMRDLHVQDQLELNTCAMTRLQLISRSLSTEPADPSL